ncbi:MAG: glycosyltransferase family 61 protein [Bryobacteraceae bacterium]
MSRKKQIHHFDPSRLEAISKLVDEDYAPRVVLVPPTSQLRKPQRGRLWHDKASDQKAKRDFSARRIPFSATSARIIESPLLTREMILFDEQRLYLDTSIELEYSEKLALPEVMQRFGEAITASVDAPVDERFRDDTVLISHHEGGGTWGHYLVQSIPRMLLFLEAFPFGKIAVPAWHAEGANGFGEALEFYKIPKKHLAPIDDATIYPLKRAVLLDFLFNFTVAAPHPKVLPLLRGFELRRAKSRSGSRAAFIKRRTDSQRAIGNQKAVDEVLARHGIDTYGPQQLPLRQQVEIWQNHDFLIATLGSDLTNMVYARPGTRVLVLSPDWFGDAFFFELSVAAGVRWHELRCGEMARRNKEEERFSNFNVDVGLLDSALTSLL